MNQVITGAIVSSLLLAASQAIAGDPTTSDTMTAQQKQMMRECTVKQQAKDSSMSKDAIKSACLSEMRARDSGSQTNGNPPSEDGTRNPEPDTATPKQ